MPTRRSSSRIRARAASPFIPLCSSSVSPIWRSTVCSGFSDVIGSWKIMPIWSPRTARRTSAPAPISSVPRRRMLPRGWLARG
jgi:hypothetical protein